MSVFDETWTYSDGTIVTHDDGFIETSCDGWRSWVDTGPGWEPARNAGNEARNVLAAAAPELFRALSRVLESFEDPSELGIDLTVAIDAALRKARGE